MKEIDGYVSEHSRSSIRLRCILSGGKEAIATGFFQKSKDRIYLVSNWHVFSGKDCFTGKCIDPNGATPISFEFSIHVGVFESGKNHQTITKTIKIRITNDDLGQDPIWMQHPRGPSIDLACIDVTSEVSTAKLYFPETKDVKLEMQLRPGSEVSIVGYPKGLSVQQGLPVWKRASVASEPGYWVNGLNIFLVDSATREGMSGAPVIQMLRLPPKEENGRVVDLVLTKFVGVYSGRYGVRDEFEAQIGRVVRREELYRMFESLSEATI